MPKAPISHKALQTLVNNLSPISRRIKKFIELLVERKTDDRKFIDAFEKQVFNCEGDVSFRSIVNNVQKIFVNEKPTREENLEEALALQKSRNILLTANGEILKAIEEDSKNFTTFLPSIFPFASSLETPKSSIISNFQTIAITLQEIFSYYKAEITPYLASQNNALDDLNAKIDLLKKAIDNYKNPNSSSEETTETTSLLTNRDKFSPEEIKPTDSTKINASKLLEFLTTLNSKIDLYRIKINTPKLYDDDPAKFIEEFRDKIFSELAFVPDIVVAGRASPRRNELKPLIKKLNDDYGRITKQINDSKSRTFEFLHIPKNGSFLGKFTKENYTIYKGRQKIIVDSFNNLVKNLVEIFTEKTQLLIPEFIPSDPRQPDPYRLAMELLINTWKKLEKTIQEIDKKESKISAIKLEPKPEESNPTSSSSTITYTQKQISDSLILSSKGLSPKLLLTRESSEHVISSKLKEIAKIADCKIINNKNLQIPITEDLRDEDTYQILISNIRVDQELLSYLIYQPHVIDNFKELGLQEVKHNKELEIYGEKANAALTSFALSTSDQNTILFITEHTIQVPNNPTLIVKTTIELKNKLYNVIGFNYKLQPLPAVAAEPEKQNTSLPNPTDSNSSPAPAPVNELKMEEDESEPVELAKNLLKIVQEYKTIRSLKDDKKFIKTFREKLFHGFQNIVSRVIYYLGQPGSKHKQPEFPNLIQSLSIASRRILAELDIDKDNPSRTEIVKNFHEAIGNLASVFDKNWQEAFPDSIGKKPQQDINILKTEIKSLEDFLKPKTNVPTSSSVPETPKKEALKQTEEKKEKPPEKSENFADFAAKFQVDQPQIFQEIVDWKSLKSDPNQSQVTLFSVLKSIPNCQVDGTLVTNKTEQEIDQTTNTLFFRSGRIYSGLASMAYTFFSENPLFFKIIKDKLETLLNQKINELQNDSELKKHIPFISENSKKTRSFSIAPDPHYGNFIEIKISDEIPTEKKPNLTVEATITIEQQNGKLISTVNCTDDSHQRLESMRLAALLGVPENQFTSPPNPTDSNSAPAPSPSSPSVSGEPAQVNESKMEEKKSQENNNFAEIIANFHLNQPQILEDIADWKSLKSDPKQPRATLASVLKNIPNCKIDGTFIADKTNENIGKLFDDLTNIDNIFTRGSNSKSTFKKDTFSYLFKLDTLSDLFDQASSFFRNCPLFFKIVSDKLKIIQDQKIKELQNNKDLEQYASNTWGKYSQLFSIERNPLGSAIEIKLKYIIPSNKKIDLVAETTLSLTQNQGKLSSTIQCTDNAQEWKKSITFADTIIKVAAIIESFISLTEVKHLDETFIGNFRSQISPDLEPIINEIVKSETDKSIISLVKRLNNSYEEIKHAQQTHQQDSPETLAKKKRQIIGNFYTVAALLYSILRNKYFQLTEYLDIKPSESKNESGNEADDKEKDSTLKGHFNVLKKQVNLLNKQAKNHFDDTITELIEVVRSFIKVNGTNDKNFIKKFFSEILPLLESIIKDINDTYEILANKEDKELPQLIIALNTTHKNIKSLPSDFSAKEKRELIAVNFSTLVDILENIYIKHSTQLNPGFTPRASTMGFPVIKGKDGTKLLDKEHPPYFAQLQEQTNLLKKLSGNLPKTSAKQETTAKSETVSKPQMTLQTKSKRKNMQMYSVGGYRPHKDHKDLKEIRKQEGRVSLSLPRINRELLLPKVDPESQKTSAELSLVNLLKTTPHCEIDGKAIAGKTDRAIADLFSNLSVRPNIIKSLQNYPGFINRFKEAGINGLKANSKLNQILKENDIPINWDDSSYLQIFSISALANNLLQVHVKYDFPTSKTDFTEFDLSAEIKIIIDGQNPPQLLYSDNALQWMNSLQPEQNAPKEKTPKQKLTNRLAVTIQAIDDFDKLNLPREKKYTGKSYIAEFNKKIFVILNPLLKGLINEYGNTVIEDILTKLIQIEDFRKSIETAINESSSLLSRKHNTNQVTNNFDKITHLLKTILVDDYKRLIPGFTPTKNIQQLMDELTSKVKAMPISPQPVPAANEEIKEGKKEEDTKQKNPQEPPATSKTNSSNPAATSQVSSTEAKSPVQVSAVLDAITAFLNLIKKESFEKTEFQNAILAPLNQYITAVQNAIDKTQDPGRTLSALLLSFSADLNKSISNSPSQKNTSWIPFLSAKPSDDDLKKNIIKYFYPTINALKQILDKHEQLLAPGFISDQDKQNIAKLSDEMFKNLKSIYEFYFPPQPENQEDENQETVINEILNDGKQEEETKESQPTINKDSVVVSSTSEGVEKTGLSGIFSSVKNFFGDDVVKSSNSKNGNANSIQHIQKSPEEIWKFLKNLTESNLESYKSKFRSNAVGRDDSINQILKECLESTKLAIVYDPVASRASPADQHDINNQKQGIYNYCKGLLGFVDLRDIQDADVLAPNSINFKKYPLKPGCIDPNKFQQPDKSNKPIVMVMNTESEIGSHWIVTIILPPHYEPPFGKTLDNQIPLIITIDPKGVLDLSADFKQALMNGHKGIIDAPVGDIESQLPTGALSNAQFIKNEIKQQKTGSGCAPWVIYDALITILTGKKPDEFIRPDSNQEQEFAFRAMLKDFFDITFKKDENLSLKNLSTKSVSEKPKENTTETSKTQITSEVQIVAPKTQGVQPKPEAAKQPPTSEKLADPIDHKQTQGIYTGALDWMRNLWNEIKPNFESQTSETPKPENYGATPPKASDLPPTVAYPTGNYGATPEKAPELPPLLANTDIHPQIDESKEALLKYFSNIKRLQDANAKARGMFEELKNQIQAKNSDESPTVELELTTEEITDLHKKHFGELGPHAKNKSIGLKRFEELVKEHLDKTAIYSKNMINMLTLDYQPSDTKSDIFKAKLLIIENLLEVFNERKKIEFKAITHANTQLLLRAKQKKRNEELTAEEKELVKTLREDPDQEIRDLVSRHNDVALRNYLLAHKNNLQKFKETLKNPDIDLEKLEISAKLQTQLNSLSADEIKQILVIYWNEINRELTELNEIKEEIFSQLKELPTPEINNEPETKLPGNSENQYSEVAVLSPPDNYSHIPETQETKDKIEKDKTEKPYAKMPPVSTATPPAQTGLGTTPENMAATQESTTTNTTGNLEYTIPPLAQSEQPKPFEFPKDYLSLPMHIGATGVSQYGAMPPIQLPPPSGPIPTPYAVLPGSQSETESGGTSGTSASSPDFQSMPKFDEDKAKLGFIPKSDIDSLLTSKPTVTFSTSAPAEIPTATFEGSEDDFLIEEPEAPIVQPQFTNEQIVKSLACIDANVNAKMATVETAIENAQSALNNTSGSALSPETIQALIKDLDQFNAGSVSSCIFPIQIRTQAEIDALTEAERQTILNDPNKKQNFNNKWQKIKNLQKLNEKLEHLKEKERKLKTPEKLTSKTKKIHEKIATISSNLDKKYEKIVNTLNTPEERKNFAVFANHEHQELHKKINQLGTNANALKEQLTTHLDEQPITPEEKEKTESKLEAPQVKKKDKARRFKISELSINDILHRKKRKKDNKRYLSLEDEIPPADEPSSVVATTKQSPLYIDPDKEAAAIAEAEKWLAEGIRQQQLLNVAANAKNGSRAPWITATVLATLVLVGIGASILTMGGFTLITLPLLIAALGLEGFTLYQTLKPRSSSSVAKEDLEQLAMTWGAREILDMLLSDAKYDKNKILTRSDVAKALLIILQTKHSAQTEYRHMVMETVFLRYRGCKAWQRRELNEHARYKSLESRSAIQGNPEEAFRLIDEVIKISIEADLPGAIAQNLNHFVKNLSRHGFNLKSEKGKGETQIFAAKIFESLYSHDGKSIPKLNKSFDIADVFDNMEADESKQLYAADYFLKLLDRSKFAVPQRICITRLLIKRERNIDELMREIIVAYENKQPEIGKELITILYQACVQSSNPDKKLARCLGYLMTHPIAANNYEITASIALEFLKKISADNLLTEVTLSLNNTIQRTTDARSRRLIESRDALPSLINLLLTTPKDRKLADKLTPDANKFANQMFLAEKNDEQPKAIRTRRRNILTFMEKAHIKGQKEPLALKEKLYSLIKITVPNLPETKKTAQAIFHACDHSTSRIINSAIYAYEDVNNECDRSWDIYAVTYNDFVKSADAITKAGRIAVEKFNIEIKEPKETRNQAEIERLQQEIQNKKEQLAPAESFVKEFRNTPWGILTDFENFNPKKVYAALQEIYPRNLTRAVIKRRMQRMFNAVDNVNPDKTETLFVNAMSSLATPADKKHWSYSINTRLDLILIYLNFLQTNGIGISSDARTQIIQWLTDLATHTDKLNFKPGADIKYAVMYAGKVLKAIDEHRIADQQNAPYDQSISLLTEMSKVQNPKKPAAGAEASGKLLWHFLEVEHAKELKAEQAQGQLTAKITKEQLIGQTAKEQFDRDIKLWKDTLAYQSTKPLSVYDHERERVELIKRTFTLMNFGGLIFLDAAGNEIPASQMREIPLAAFLSHGGRVAMLIPSSVDARRFWNWYTAANPNNDRILNKNVNNANNAKEMGDLSTTFNRPGAGSTHQFTVTPDGRLKEIKRGASHFHKMAGETVRNVLINGHLTAHWGTDIALGGAGNISDYDGEPISADGSHGHFYTYFKEEVPISTIDDKTGEVKKEKCALLAFGVEGAAYKHKAHYDGRTHGALGAVFGGKGKFSASGNLKWIDKDFVAGSEADFGKNVSPAKLGGLTLYPNAEVLEKLMRGELDFDKNNIDIAKPAASQNADFTFAPQADREIGMNTDELSQYNSGLLQKLLPGLDEKSITLKRNILKAMYKGYLANQSKKKNAQPQLVDYSVYMHHTYACVKILEEEKNPKIKPEKEEEILPLEPLENPKNDSDLNSRVRESFTEIIQKQILDSLKLPQSESIEITAGLLHSYGQQIFYESIKEFREKQQAAGKDKTLEFDNLAIGEISTYKLFKQLMSQLKDKTSQDNLQKAFNLTWVGTLLDEKASLERTGKVLAEKSQQIRTETEFKFKHWVSDFLTEYASITAEIKNEKLPVAANKPPVDLEKTLEVARHLSDAALAEKSAARARERLVADIAKGRLLSFAKLADIGKTHVHETLERELTTPADDADGTSQNNTRIFAERDNKLIDKQYNEAKTNFTGLKIKKNGDLSPFQESIAPSRGLLGELSEETSSRHILITKIREILSLKTQLRYRPDFWSKKADFLHSIPTAELKKIRNCTLELISRSNISDTISLFKDNFKEYHSELVMKILIISLLKSPILNEHESNGTSDIEKATIQTKREEIKNTLTTLLKAYFHVEIENKNQVQAEKEKCTNLDSWVKQITAAPLKNSAPNQLGQKAYNCFFSAFCHIAASSEYPHLYNESVSDELIKKAISNFELNLQNDKTFEELQAQYESADFSQKGKTDGKIRERINELAVPLRDVITAHLETTFPLPTNQEEVLMVLQKRLEALLEIEEKIIEKGTWSFEFKSTVKIQTTAPLEGQLENLSINKAIELIKEPLKDLERSTQREPGVELSQGEINKQELALTTLRNMVIRYLNIRWPLSVDQESPDNQRKTRIAIFNRQQILDQINSIIHKQQWLPATKETFTTRVIAPLKQNLQDLRDKNQVPKTTKPASTETEQKQPLKAESPAAGKFDSEDLLSDSETAPLTRHSP